MNWQEIHGFSSPGEFTHFVTYIEHQVTEGIAEEIKPNDTYGKGEIYGGRWFRDIDSGKIWRLVEPDFPFKGLWEQVDEEDKKKGVKIEWR